MILPCLKGIRGIKGLNISAPHWFLRRMLNNTMKTELIENDNSCSCKVFHLRKIIFRQNTKGIFSSNL